MTLNKQDIPEFKKGDVFIATLPSRELLLKRFKNEKKDKRIKAFVENLLHPTSPRSYSLYVRETECGLDGLVYIDRTLLEGNTVLLCKKVSSHSVFGGAPVALEIIHSDVVKSIDAVTDYIGYNTPAIYLKLLTDITPLRTEVVI